MLMIYADAFTNPLTKINLGMTGISYTVKESIVSSHRGYIMIPKFELKLWDLLVKERYCFK